MNDMEPEMKLIGAVIEAALEDKSLNAATWLAGPCGHWWLTLAGLDPEWVWNMAGYKKKKRRYVALATCVCGATGSDLTHMRKA